MNATIKNLTMRSSPVFMLSALLFGCVKIPAGISPVDGFEIDRYLGRWYEIARLDHRFERGLEQVSAEYSLLPNGGVKVVNRGFSTEEQLWKEAEGTAFFVDSPSEGHLKVSFFGPFYSSYVIFELDQQGYEYAFVSGANTSYLWLLARSAEVAESIKSDFIRKADDLGFDTSELIWVTHKPN